MGFEAGKTYRVCFRGSARIQEPSVGSQWPTVWVTLGGQVIVSAHQVSPVAKRDHFSAPFVRVQRAAFRAPAAGPCELVSETLQKDSSTILLDAVSIEEMHPLP